MKTMRLLGVLFTGLFLVFLVTALPAKASPVSINFSGNVAGGPVSGTLGLDVSSANTLIIQLTDTFTNPKDVGQLISDFSFDISGMSGPATLMSSLGQEGSISDKGIPTLGSTGNAMWGLDSIGSNVILSALASGPSNLIIGPPGSGGMYSNANGSIAGNRAHNPFLMGTVTFQLEIPGLTSLNQLNNMMVSFGTTPGSDLRVQSGVTPEPSSLLLLGTGLLALGFCLKRRSLAS